jgi:hypothetical protein
VTGEYFFADTFVLVILFELESSFRCGRGSGEALHLGEAVFGVPGVGPASIAGQIPVGVVEEAFRGFGNEHMVRGAGTAAEGLIFHFGPIIVT